MRELRTYTLVTLATLMAYMALAMALPARAQPSTQPVESRYPAGEIIHQHGEGGYLPAKAAGPAYLSILDVVGKLIIAVLIAYALLHGLRWWQDNRMHAGASTPRGGPQMKLEETLSLGPDGRLYLVEVEDHRMLFAGREGGLRQVAELNEEIGRPATYRSVRQRADGSTDELNVVQSRTSTRPIRTDLTEEGERWEKRRNRLLAELQEQD